MTAFSIIAEQSVIMLSVVVLNVANNPCMLSVTMLNLFMLNVVAHPLYLMVNFKTCRSIVDKSLLYCVDQMPVGQMLFGQETSLKSL
jgi:hypothetical protein